MLTFAISGTRKGMTDPQIGTFCRIIDSCPKIVRHGDCVGVDADAHRIVREWFGDSTCIHIHPPKDSKCRAMCGNLDDGPTQVHTEAPYLKRNRTMVDKSDVVLAFPGGFREERRSGTWSVIRYAKKTGKQLHVVFPDGTIDSTAGPSTPSAASSSSS